MGPGPQCKMKTRGPLSKNYYEFHNGDSRAFNQVQGLNACEAGLCGDPGKGSRFKVCFGGKNWPGFWQRLDTEAECLACGSPGCPWATAHTQKSLLHGMDRVQDPWGSPSHLLDAKLSQVLLKSHAQMGGGGGPLTPPSLPSP